MFPDRDPTPSRRRAAARIRLAVIVVTAVVTVGGVTLGAAGVGAIVPTHPTVIGSGGESVGTGGAGSAALRTGIAPDTAAAINRTEVERLVHERINRERVERGLAPLSVNRDLRAVARNHSRDMATEGYVSHVEPDGGTMADRYATAGIRCRVPTADGLFATGAENIVYTHYDAPIQRGDRIVRHRTPEALAEAIVTLWMNSPGHRTNVLKPYWNAEGIGIYFAVAEASIRVYVTQNFC